MQRIAATAKLNLPKAASYHLKRKLRLQARNAANAAIADVHRSMTKKREEIRARHRQFGYLEWLKREAEHGNVSAIYALRKRGAVVPTLVKITTSDLHDDKYIVTKVSHVTGRGTVFYRVEEDVIRDTGAHLSLKKEIGEEGIEAALRIAMVKFGGRPLAVNGSDEFKMRCVKVAAKSELSVIFADTRLENQKELLHQALILGNDPNIENQQLARKFQLGSASENEGEKAMYDRGR